MPRHILDESKIHPAIRERIAKHHESMVKEVQQALIAHPVVVAGMRQNPLVRKARQALAAAGIPFQYIEHGSYLSQWRRRNALKMWTGWPTFPMVFVKGMLIGGYDELAKLIASGELKAMLAGGRSMAARRQSVTTKNSAVSRLSVAVPGHLLTYAAAIRTTGTDWA